MSSEFPEAAPVILVRHVPVADRYQGICYGQSDVELDETGRNLSQALASQLAPLKPERIFHSGLQRTKVLAEELARQTGVQAICCPELRERDFGSWELQPWDALHDEFGEAILRMVCQPDTFRPGGGETTFQMRDRVLRWFASLPQEGATVAVTHGGPIAALVAAQRDLPVSAWPSLIPPLGQSVWLRGSQSTTG
jgi:broad specificity phosphatase PhoE